MISDYLVSIMVVKSIIIDAIELSRYLFHLLNNKYLCWLMVKLQSHSNVDANLYPFTHKWDLYVRTNYDLIQN